MLKMAISTIESELGCEVPLVFIYLFIYVGLGGLGVTCSSRGPRFTGTNPVEVDGFFHDVKILTPNPPGGTFSWGSRV